MDFTIHYITRKILTDASKDALSWINDNQDLMFEKTRNILRNQDFSIDFKHPITILKNINFFYNNIDEHWADTDSLTININKKKDWTYQLLVHTLIHEAIHFMIKQNNRHYTTSYKEHQIMEAMNPLLV